MPFSLLSISLPDTVTNLEQQARRAPVIEMIEASIAAAQPPETVLLEQVNWRIAPGEFWALAGLPGAGKSELLAVAAGVQRPVQGSIRLFGKETTKLSERELLQERICIGLVFAGGGRLFHHLSVRENIALALCYHRNCRPDDAADQVNAVLEATDLISVAGYIPRQLSNSWRQRAALARALVLRPEVLLLENFLAGLEPVQLLWWREMLGELARGHPFMDRHPMTLVVATHNLQLWIDQASHFAVLKDKRFIPFAGRGALVASQEPLLRELRVGEWSVPRT